MTRNDLPHSLPAIMERRARESPRLAFRFLTDGTTAGAVDWTYRDLADHAAVVTADLRALGLTGERVVLALDPGLDYLAALFGILAAGATVVPSFPPRGRRAEGRFLSIVGDSAPAAVVADPRYAARVPVLERALPPDVPRPRWLLERGTAGRPAGPGPRTPATAALLQYTSGSTGDPKGIVLTHDNLVSNCATSERAIGVEPDRVGVSWLPPYHDMGLMGTIMQALYGGWPLVLMSPAHFVQRPYRWLRAITDHAATITMAPNFALDLCVDTITDDELRTLDLRSLRQLFCGSEPVLAATLERFSDRFAPRGYRESSLVPCYGMAEATLLVSAKAGAAPPRIDRVDPLSLERCRPRPAVPGFPAARVVSCGVVADGHRLLIVEPNSREPLPAGDVGEIWVHGPNVAAGYLDRPHRTQETFAARPAGDDSGDTWLRTGDLGFLVDDELFVTGRSKDVIVLAGRNIHPQDVELSATSADPALWRAAAFSSAAGDGPEELVVVAEFTASERPTERDVAAAREAVVAAVTADYGVRPATVHLGPVGTIPVTTSGKIRRSATRDAFRDGTLRTVPRRAEAAAATR